MWRTAILLFSAVMLISCAQNKPVAEVNSDRMYILQDYIFKLEVLNKQKQPEIESHLAALRPLPSDFKIYEADLNNDGKVDFLSSTQHYIFDKNGTFPLYVMIADQYGFSPMAGTPRITSFKDVSALPAVHKGYHDIKISGITYAYDGTTYKEVK